MRSFLLLTALLTLTITKISAQYEGQTYIPDPDPLIQKRIEDWQDIKFGLLMHWGPYSQWGIVESWSICPEDEPWCVPDTVKDYFAYKKKYENLGKTFNPTKFDPEKWAKAAKNAGMKYVVFTTKHHDGFCMFDTQYTDYKITSNDCSFHTNPKSDVTRAIFDAFRKEGLWVGAYFSKPDWHNNDYWWQQFPPFDRNPNYSLKNYPEKWNNFKTFTHNQIMELCSNYGKLDILWLDGGQVQKIEVKEETPHINGFQIKKMQNQDINMDELVEKIRTKQPEVIVVDRAVVGKNQNYLTPENHVPDRMLPYPWESCMILGGGWSFSFDAEMMPSRKVIHLLCDIVAKGGNLLLNIGPGPDGTWYDDAYICLEEIGNWLKFHGDAIYNTRPIAPYFDNKLRFTQGKDGSVYIIYLLDEGEILPSKIKVNGFIPGEKAQINMLGLDDDVVKWNTSENSITLSLTKKQSATTNAIYAVVFKVVEK